MDLPKEFLAEVLNERICLASNFSSGNEKKNLTTTTNSSLSCPTQTNKQQESAIIEANKYLENLKSMSIHVLLGHSECKEVGDKLCSAMQDTEVFIVNLMLYFLKYSSVFSKKVLQMTTFYVNTSKIRYTSI
uniref:Uncharacterized protein n=1 Tax=Meloidogyne enterolobii TaxID=390850 RepID=A0A6V7YCP6_MELEN|nr:unnamed protein product [Meloidogyne enterolobii]